MNPLPKLCYLVSTSTSKTNQVLRKVSTMSFSITRQVYQFSVHTEISVCFECRHLTMSAQSSRRYHVPMNVGRNMRKSGPSRKKQSGPIPTSKREIHLKSVLIIKRLESCQAELLNGVQVVVSGRRTIEG